MEFCNPNSNFCIWRVLSPKNLPYTVLIISALAGVLHEIVRGYTGYSIGRVIEECRTRSYSPDVANQKANPELHLSVGDIIKRRGYPVEEHTVETKDGYLLTLHRIPGSPKRDLISKYKFKQSKRTVLLQHGLGGSSADFAGHGALGYYLADRGIDVWIGNFRGNAYSLEHKWIKESDREFWKFSLDQWGLEDVPAEIDYILAKTGQKQIDYIGHSMGSAALHALLSEKPEYNKKIRLFISLAPSVYLGEIYSPLKYLAYIWDYVDAVTNFIGINRIYSQSLFATNLAEGLCHDDALTQIFCHGILYVLGENTSKQLNKTNLPLILSHFPQDTSIRSISHALQMYYSGKFQAYDHGPESNSKIYGSPTPREYDPKKTQVPVYIFWADMDVYISEKGLVQLAEELPNLKKRRFVPVPFGHLDFLIGNDAEKFVYSEIVNILEEAK